MDEGGSVAGAGRAGMARAWHRLAVAASAHPNKANSALPFLLGIGLPSPRPSPIPVSCEPLTSLLPSPLPLSLAPACVVCCCLMEHGWLTHVSCAPGLEPQRVLGPRSSLSLFPPCVVRCPLPLPLPLRVIYIYPSRLCLVPACRRGVGTRRLGGIGLPCSTQSKYIALPPPLRLRYI
eukprot:scaffold6707_cov119-Isochrysis_galbana.AAC.3